MKLSRILIALLACLLAGSVLGQRLIVGTVAEASDLDPRTTYDVYSYQRMYPIMEPLIVLDTDLGYRPRLAHSWDFAEDGSQVTFYLREGVRFHHGREFTADDVKYTFDWVLNPENPAANPGLYEDIELVEVVDPYTVTFHLTGENAFILNYIARLHIVPADLGDDPSFGSAPVGTGAFEFVSWSRDDRMILKAFEEYWDGRAKVDEVEFRPITEDSTRLLAFEAGELDIYHGQVVPAEVPRLEGDDRFVVQRVTGLGHAYLGFNLRNEELAKPEVRHAFSHLLPREAIVERVYEGVGTVGTGPISPDTAFYNPDIPTYEYDPELARELLEQAGVEGLTLRLHTNENPVRMQIAEVLQFEAANIGIDVEIHIEEFGAFIDRIMDTDTADFDIFILGWSGNVDPNYAMYELFHSAGGSNFIAYGNPDLDELLETGRRLPPDSEESVAVYKEAQAILMADAPFAFINNTEEVGLNQSWISGWEIHPYTSATYQDLHLIEKKR